MKYDRRDQEGIEKEIKRYKVRSDKERQEASYDETPEDRDEERQLYIEEEKNDKLHEACKNKR